MMGRKSGGPSNNLQSGDDTIPKIYPIPSKQHHLNEEETADCGKENPQKAHC